MQNMLGALDIKFPDPIGIDQLKRRNALEERDMRWREQNALAQQAQFAREQEDWERLDAVRRNPNATPDDFSREGAPLIGNALRQSAHDQEENDILTLYHASSQVEGASDPIATMRVLLGSPQLTGIFRKHGIDPMGFDSEDPNEMRTEATQLRQRLEPFLKQRPTSEELVQTVGRDGRPVYTPRSRAVGMTPYEKPAVSTPQFAPVTLDDGSIGSFDARSGRIAPTGHRAPPKRDPNMPPGFEADPHRPGAWRPVEGGPQDPNRVTLSKTQLGVVKQKLVTVQALRTQLQKVLDAFAGIRNTYSAGPGGGMVPSEKGQRFDRAVALLSPLFRQLTRVPGEGAMSDFEAKLAQLALPERGSFEGNTEKQIQDINDLIDQIDNGYRVMLGHEPRAGLRPQSTPTGNPVSIRSDAEYDALPSGTVFMGPDGQARRKP